MVPKNGGWRDHGVGAQVLLQDLNSSSTRGRHAMGVMDNSSVVTIQSS
jgi:hypothetical protein